MARRIFFVVNPRSANGRTGRDWPALLRQAERVLGPVGVGLTRGPGHAGELAGLALRDGYEAVVAVGGDGTVNEALNGFLEAASRTPTGASFGYLPSATGGDLARTLGLAGLNTAALLERLAQATPRLLDHGRATFVGPDGKTTSRCFMNEASVGFSADTVDAVNRSTKAFGGKASFAIGVLRCLAGLRRPRVRVLLDGESFYEGPVFLVTVANGRYFGGSMMIAPEARPDDGLLDVVLMEPLRRRDVVRNLGKIYQGRHLGLPGVHSGRGRIIEVQSDEPVLIEMDGEQPGRLDARFEIVPASVPFLA